MPRKVFVAGEILTAADVNTNLMDQAVMVFDDSSARGSAIPSPSEGMVTYLKDTDALEKYTTAWEAIDTAGILQVVSAARTTTFTTTSTSLVDWTDVTVNITPSSTSSKVLLFLSIPLWRNSSSTLAVFAELDRGGTALFSESAATGSGASTGNIIFLDSPNTTSATTYKARVKVNGGTGTFESGSLTAMEVAG